MKNAGESLVRILEVRLKNFKNVRNGKVEMSDISKLEKGVGDILGIYGQNGSGKTAVISAIRIVKELIVGMPLPDDIYEYITYGEKESEIEILFYMIINNKRYKARYKLVISEESDNPYIKEESLDYWTKESTQSGWDKVKGLITNRYNDNNIWPLLRNKEIVDLYEDKNDFIVNKKMKFKQNKSFIFSRELSQLVYERLGKEYQIIYRLKEYASLNLFVIDNKVLALSEANIILPMNFKNIARGNQSGAVGVLGVEIARPGYLSKDKVEHLKTSLKASNKVLDEIIPGLSIKIKELEPRISKKGEEEVLVELLSCRKDVEIPIRYESDGIKKIVAVIHLLVGMYNYSSMTIAIDELDSGIFEYLLGEILEILEQRGKGQLIFTSHNLRPLEVLNKDNLVFTTTNPNKRYIKLKNVKTNNNLRDLYYRDLVLDGQDEVIYDQTNSAKIARAFRKAGV